MVLQKVLAVSPADMQGPRPRAGGTARPPSTVSAYPVKLCSSSSSLSQWENTPWSYGSWELQLGQGGRPPPMPRHSGVMQEGSRDSPWITSWGSHFKRL